MTGSITIPYCPRPSQKRIHDLLEAHRFVVLVAHRRFGKTVLAVNHLLKMALLCTRQRGSFGYVAPFRNQAKEIAWAYLKHFSASLPGRTVSETELSVTLPNGARIRVFGADNADALRGLYFDGVVLDEVAQMRAEVWTEILRPALADRQGWAVFIGTPKGINLFHDLYQKAVRLESEGSSDWRALVFRADETDSLPPEELDRLRAELTPIAWRQEMLCDFSASADDALISLDLVTEALNRETPVFSGGPVILGVDVARFGADSSVIFRRQGLMGFAPLVMHKMDNMRLADLVAVEIRNHQPDAVFIDAGQGQGVIDRLRQLGHPVMEVPFGGRALNNGRFANRRAEMWYAVRDWLMAGGCLCRQGDWNRLRSELCAPSYSFDAAGRIVLESKDAIRERLGTSPDLADALALTFAAPVMDRGGTPHLARRDFDPLAWGKEAA